MKGSRKKVVLGLSMVLTMVVGVLAGQAFAGSSDNQPDAEAPQPHAVVTLSGKAVQRTKIVTGDSAQEVMTSTPTDLTGATTTMKVGTAGALLDIRFSGESMCYDGVVGNWCKVSVLVDGVEASPNSDYSFDASMGDSGDYWEAHATERVMTVGAGTHTIKVQFYRGSGTPTFRLDDWTLAVQRIGL